MNAWIKMLEMFFAERTKIWREKSRSRRYKKERDNRFKGYERELKFKKYLAKLYKVSADSVKIEFEGRTSDIRTITIRPKETGLYAAISTPSYIPISILKLILSSEIYKKDKFKTVGAIYYTTTYTLPLKITIKFYGGKQ